MSYNDQERNFASESGNLVSLAKIQTFKPVNKRYFCLQQTDVTAHTWLDGSASNMPWNSTVFKYRGEMAL